MSAVLSAPSLSDRFAWVVALLCRGLRTSSPKHGPGGPLGVLAWNRLQRLLARFLALVASVEAGRLAAPRRAIVRQAQSPGADATPSPALVVPGISGWLLRLAPGLDTRIGLLQLETLVTAPELAALLAQAPQAGRVLRPLCHMLGIKLPPVLRLPRRPRVRRPPPAAPVCIEAAGGAVPADALPRVRPMAWRLHLPPPMALPD